MKTLGKRTAPGDFRDCAFGFTCVYHRVARSRRAIEHPGEIVRRRAILGRTAPKHVAFAAAASGLPPPAFILGHPAARHLFLSGPERRARVPFMA